MSLLHCKAPVHDALCVDISIPQKRRGLPWSPTLDELGSLIHDKFPGFIVGIMLAYSSCMARNSQLIKQIVLQHSLGHDGRGIPHPHCSQSYRHILSTRKVYRTSVHPDPECADILLRVCAHHFLLFRSAEATFSSSIALTIVSNVLLIKAFPYAMYTIGCGFAASIPNVLVNRLIFNLRAWAKCNAENGLALDEIDKHTLGLCRTQC